MSNRDPNLGGKSQVERLQTECFLNAHVPSAQTNRHDSPHAVLGPSTPHTTASAPPTSPAGDKCESPPPAASAGMSGVKGPARCQCFSWSTGRLSQDSASMLCMCSSRECSTHKDLQECCFPIPVFAGSHSLFLFPAGKFSPVEPGLGHRCVSTVPWVLIRTSLHL